MNVHALLRWPALIALLAIVLVIGVFETTRAPAAPLAAQFPDLRVQQDTEDAVRFPLTAVRLEPGWNLVGWTGDASAVDVALATAGPFRSLFTYDAAVQDFRSFSPAAPAFLNTVDNIAFGDGVWIFVEQETDWFQPAPWWARSVELLSGFNLVTWTGPSDTPIDEALGGLGSALVTAFTYDATRQSFRSFGPDRPVFLNSAEVLNYGDGVWLELSRAATWDQLPLQRIGTQDVTFIRRIARLDESGGEVDFTDQVLAAAEADLGLPIALRFGLVFQEARSLSGGAVAENGVPLPSVAMTFGIITRSSTSPSTAADAFLGTAERVFVAISSAHLEQANYNLDLNDFADVDLSAVEGIAVGDKLRLDFLLAQTLEGEGPLAEDGLSETEVFARRWNDGDLQIVSAADADGQLAAALFTGQEASVVAGSVNARWMAKAAAVAAVMEAGALTDAFAAVGGDPILLPFVELLAVAQLDSFLGAIAAVLLANLAPLDVVEYRVDTPLPAGTPIPPPPPPPAAPSDAPAPTPLPSDVAAVIAAAGGNPEAIAELFAGLFSPFDRPTITIETSPITADSEIKVHFGNLTPNRQASIRLRNPNGDMSPSIIVTADFKGEAWKDLPPLQFPGFWSIWITDTKTGTKAMPFVVQ